MSNSGFDISGSVTAWNLLIDEHIDRLPLRPTQIIGNHGYHLFTYKEYADATGRTIPDIIEKYGPDAFTKFMSDEYMIIYNPARKTARIRWSLMHEVAHIHLNHISAAVPVLTRETADKDHLDVEADALAARCLCPSVVAHFCGCRNQAELMQLTDLSSEAASYRWKHLCDLRQRNKFLSVKPEFQVFIQFRRFITAYIASMADTEPEVYFPSNNPRFRL